MAQLGEAERVVVAIHREIDTALHDSDVPLTPIQALILARMGTAEMSSSQIESTGVYCGDNCSYNVRKMVDRGFLAERACEHDRRSHRLSVTPKGREVAALVRKVVAQSQHLARVRIIP